MAVRTVRIGQYPDYRDEVRGPLAEILAYTANPGAYAAPEDVTGTSLEMGADGKWTGATLGTLTQVQADALVALGVMAKVKAGVRLDIGGTEATWNGTGVVASGNLSFTDLAAATAWATANPSLVYDGLLATAGGYAVAWRGGAWANTSSIIPCFNTIAARDAAYPTPSLGQKVCVRRLYGAGYFEQMWNGSNWGVVLGQSVINDATGYQLTATSTAYTQLMSYTIPGNLIRDGERWDLDIDMLCSTFISGFTVPTSKISTAIINTTISTNGANRYARSVGGITRVGNRIRTQAPSGDGYPCGGNLASGSSYFDIALDLASDQSISVGIVPGAINDVSKLLNISLRRSA